MASIHTVLTESGPRYQVRYRTPDHKARKETFRRLDEARRRRTELERSLHRGTYLDPTRGLVSLEEWCEAFLQEAELAPSTKALYETQARLYILPALGGRPLQAITRDDVESLYAHMKAAGKGPATIAVTHRLLSRLLAKAVKAERVQRNVAAGAKGDLAKPQAREPRFLEAQEVDAIAANVPDRDRVLVLTLAYTGIRIGEASFLRVRHLDLMRRRLIVEGSAKEVGGERLEGATKTGKRRAIKLPAFLADELAAHLAEHSDPTDSDAYVFTGRNGAPLRATNFRNRSFYPACKAAGLEPAPHVHDLRHTAASLAIQAGAHPKAVSEMLGHATVVLTLDLYSHLFDGLQEQLADGLDRIHREATS